MSINHRTNLLHHVALPLHAIDQIWAIERADQPFGVAQAELCGNVMANMFGRGGRIGVDADTRKPGPQLLQHAIFRTKVMSPGTDTMGFIDGEK